MSDRASPFAWQVSITDIQDAVARRFGMRLADMTSHRLARVVARPRQVAMYLASELTPHSLPAIGKHFGGRDHTTVMHACRRIAMLVEIDRELACAVADLRAELSPPPLADPDQLALPLAAE